MPPVISFIGWHNSGKTTLARQVVALLKAKGYVVAVIKSTKERGIAFDGPFANLPELVRASRKAARSGDIVVFSPGATSFGMFKNEFDRGNRFRETVLANI